MDLFTVCFTIIGELFINARWHGFATHGVIAHFPPEYDLPRAWKGEWYLT